MLVTIRRALLSVSDKTGLVELARALAARRVELLCTGGTAAPARRGAASRSLRCRLHRLSRDHGRPRQDAAPAHPRRPAGATRHRRCRDGRSTTSPPIDLLVVNLYPFAATVANPDCTYADAIENIDIGGPAMVRAAAKNHESVTVVVDPADYAHVLRRARSQRRRHQHRHAHRARRQGVRAHREVRHHGVPLPARSRKPRATESFPEHSAAGVREASRTCATARIRTSRPRSIASSARPAPASATARMLQGKELSFNNIADTDTALECVRQFNEPACVIVKHANPCGVRRGRSLRGRLRARLSHRPHLRVRRHHRLQSRAG